jgi:hypothetical protein
VILELNMISPSSSQNLEGEDDGNEVATKPVTIVIEPGMRVYPRKNDQPGTRITFANGTGFSVSESYEEVKVKLTSTS